MTRSQPGFPRELAAWVDSNRPLLDALLALRDLGDEAAEAIDAVMKVRRLAMIRLSVELWRALVAGDGEDPEEHLLEHLPFHVLDELARALWGSPWGWDDDDPGASAGAISS